MQERQAAVETQERQAAAAMEERQVAVDEAVAARGSLEQVGPAVIVASFVFFCASLLCSSSLRPVPDASSPAAGVHRGECAVRVADAGVRCVEGRV